MKKNIKYSDEINLTEFYFLIKKNIWRIIFITTITTATGYFFTLNKEVIYKLETEVVGISNSEVTKYQNFNSYLNKTSAIFLKDVQTKNFENQINFYGFKQIDKYFLFNLFIDKLYDKNSLINVLEKSNLISEENYQNSKEYETAIEDLTSQITLRLPSNDDRNQFSFIIEINTTNIKKWENFLIFIDKFINKEIQKELKIKFANQLMNEKKTKEHQIEDLQNQIIALDDMIKKHENDNNFLSELVSLRLKKKIVLTNLISENHLDRISFLFDATPVIKSNDFYAAKVMYSKRKFDVAKNSDKSSIIIAFACIGFIISIFQIYILNGLKKNK